MVTLAQSSPGDRSARAPQSKTATVMLGAARLAEGGAEGFGIGHDGVTGKVQRLAGALRRIGMAGAAGIFDHPRNDSEIGGVARGRLDADFHRNAHNGERADAAIAQREGERRTLERRHRELVEDRLARPRLQFGDDGKARGTSTARAGPPRRSGPSRIVIRAASMKSNCCRSMEPRSQPSSTFVCANATMTA